MQVCQVRAIHPGQLIPSGTVQGGGAPTVLRAGQRCLSCLRGPSGSGTHSALAIPRCLQVRCTRATTESTASNPITSMPDRRWASRSRGKNSCSLLDAPVQCRGACAAVANYSHLSDKAAASAVRRSASAASSTSWLGALSAVVRMTTMSGSKTRGIHSLPVGRGTGDGLHTLGNTNGAGIFQLGEDAPPMPGGGPTQPRNHHQPGHQRKPIQPGSRP